MFVVKSKYENYKIGFGESQKEVRERMTKAINKIIKENKDKIDKEKSCLNNLTKNLIKNNYIDEDDSSIFSYDDLFEKME